MPTDHDHALGVTCPRCGATTSRTDRHIRFTWPDAVAPPAEASAQTRAWLNAWNPEDSVLVDMPGHGAFVRVLLPIRLDDGTSVTYSTWFSVTVDLLRQAYQVWWAPQYAELTLDGRLANDVPPGGLLGAQGRAVVRDTDHTPYLAESSYPLLGRVLDDVWPAALHP